MIAVILAAAQRSEVYGLDEHLPLPLFPLADRPILHHIVDFLVGRGVRQFEFVLGHLPEKIEAYLGDGSRWGSTFNFHLGQSTSRPLELVRAITAGFQDDVVLGRGDTLPDIQPQSADGPTIYVSATEAWTGWAVLPASARHFTRFEAQTLGGFVNDDQVFKKVVVTRQLNFENVQEFLRSQKDFLNGSAGSAEISGRQIQPGVWISRNVSLQPEVQFKAPVYVGPNCKIAAGVCIGPSVVIGEGCIVDEQSSIANTLVAPGTYIGQGLELDHAIVDRNRLVNARLGTVLIVSESFLLSGLSRRKRPRVFHRIASRMSALAIFVLLLPMASLSLLFLLLNKRGRLVWERAISIPTIQDTHAWKEYQYLRLRLHEATTGGCWTSFVAEVWPGLISVVKGDLFLAGVKPRSRHDVEGLSSDWRSQYLSSKAGLITEALVMFGRAPSEDELYTAEAYYSAVQSIGHDLKLMRLYLVQLLTKKNQGPVGDFAEDTIPEPTLENVAGL